jgi:hypothetical protein
MTYIEEFITAMHPFPLAFIKSRRVTVTNIPVPAMNKTAA